MDLRRFPANALLAATLLVSGAACAQPQLLAPARQGFRFATELIRVHAPEPALAPTITAGVRG